MTKLTARRTAYLAKRNARRELDQARFSTAIAALVHKPTFVEDAEGNRVRVWSDASTDAMGRQVKSLDVVKDEDVRAWLLGLRVTTIAEGLEFVHEKYARGMIRDGYLRADVLDANRFWVTEKAAERWNLPKVMGCRFPAPTGEFGRLAPHSN
jgi:hypothetical protein